MIFAELWDVFAIQQAVIESYQGCRMRSNTTMTSRMLQPLLVAVLCQLLTKICGIAPDNSDITDDVIISTRCRARCLSRLQVRSYYGRRFSAEFRAILWNFCGGWRSGIIWLKMSARSERAKAHCIFFMFLVFFRKNFIKRRSTDVFEIFPCARGRGSTAGIESRL